MSLENDELELEIEKLKLKMEFISKFIDKFANIHSTIQTIQEQVQGGKSFRDSFEENVHKIVKQILDTKTNQESLNKLSDERIKIYLNTADFQRELKDFVKGIIELELKTKDSSSQASIRVLIDEYVKEKERQMFLKVVSMVLGSGLVMTILSEFVKGLLK